jgi:predicted RNase H-like HicB family nuclease
MIGRIRWIAEVAELPGVLAYGENPGDAQAKAQALALRVFADRLEHGEAGPDLLSKDPCVSSICL